MDHITKVHDNNDKPPNFDIYFPEDSKTRQHVNSNNLSPFTENSNEPRRGDMIGKRFLFPGDEDLPTGTWLVRRMVDNTYICVLVSDDNNGKSKSMATFDIGYVIMCYKRGEQERRENVHLSNFGL